jgi:hypothetical protein
VLFKPGIEPLLEAEQRDGEQAANDHGERDVCDICRSEGEVKS